MRRPATKSKAVPARASGPVQARPRFPAWLGAVLLALVTAALYWPATGHDFVNYDDPMYVTANVHVQNGLTLENVKWAFLNPVGGNWHPVTVLSHMADCSLFGLKPRGHHLTNVLLHACNTALVFLLLQLLTGATGRSLVVAALFAVHPLHVESVAWVAERKDVLSGFFGLLVLIFYARYARLRIGGHPPRNTPHATRFYCLSLIFFALGLMSKPMLVTWPFVMLLLDCWPLGRFKIQGSKFKIADLFRLLVEKIPFFGLAAGVSVATVMVQKSAGSVITVANVSLGVRVGNALVSYCRYLEKLFWPVDLAVFYPFLRAWPMAQVLLAGGLLLGISVLMMVARRRAPWLLMGWLWFVGTLVPVIGLVQVGEQSMADRYAYLPSLGFFIMVIWGGYELVRRRPHAVMTLSVAGSAAVVLCAGLTWRQLGYWQDTETLFRHSLAVTEGNNLALNAFGNALFDKGRIDEAVRQFREVVRLKPDDVDGHDNLGRALNEQGHVDEAIGQYQEAIRLKPDDAQTHNNLGNSLAGKGRIDEAIHEYGEAIRLKPDYPEAHNNLGAALGGKGQMDEATRQFQEAVRLKPDYAKARNNLGIALYKQGRIEDAISQYREFIRLKPDDADGHNNLGVALGAKGKLYEAISQYREAIRLKPNDADAQNNLARVLGTKTTPAGP